MDKFATEQEAFWAGEFGTDYIARNRDNARSVAGKTAFWSAILQSVDGPLESILELGSNIGINLDALAVLQPEARRDAVEINPAAVEALRRKGIHVYHESILTFSPQTQWDLAFTCGVLIHLAPERLPDAYALLAKAARKYVCIAEYYNPTPVEIEYRGHWGKLFKRDFAGEFLAANPDFFLRKYGFVYHGDPSFPVGDITWFLLEKNLN